MAARATPLPTHGLPSKILTPSAKKARDFGIGWGEGWTRAPLIKPSDFGMSFSNEDSIIHAADRHAFRSIKPHRSVQIAKSLLPGSAK